MANRKNVERTFMRLSLIFVGLFSLSDLFFFSAVQKTVAEVGDWLNASERHFDETAFINRPSEPTTVDAHRCNYYVNIACFFSSFV